ncbi:hypothetical protein AT258_26030 [Bacillus wiedmannii]|uniref:hypothetical protein n=1 Tax=Bacillus TaxID=1386 RepID=UPI00077A8668|nr:hypothetical protein [Bacillus mobilis]KXY73393.1 hypothetical protein AT258_26030 [Bacillus wiedmannii]
MKKLVDIISFEQADKEIRYYIDIYTKREVKLESYIDLADENLEEQIHIELLTYIENDSNQDEFLVVGNDAVKVSEIIHTKVRQLRFF